LVRWGPAIGPRFGHADCGIQPGDGGLRRERREVILAAGVVTVLACLLIGQAAVWFVVRRDARGTGARLAQMEAEFRRHQDGLRAIRAGIPTRRLNGTR